LHVAALDAVDILPAVDQMGVIGKEEMRPGAVFRHGSAGHLTQLSPDAYFAATGLKINL